MVFGVIGASFFLSFAICILVRDTARRLHLVDRPNDRSLHRMPVPRLGGIAVVTSVWATLAAANRFVPLLEQREVVVWIASASAIALLGLVDDLRPLPAWLRLLVQLLAAGVFVVLVSRPETIVLLRGLQLRLEPPFVSALAVVFIVAVTNIFNFMDGMDGLAATQAMAVALPVSGLGALAGHSDLALVGLAIAGGVAGFGIHNMPPATIFMGDVGSTFLGFGFATLALLAARRPEPIPVLVFPTLLAPFLMDGTFTMLRRLRGGERIWHAHRTHLYQRAVATGLTHGAVLRVYAAWCVTAAFAGLIVARASVWGALGAWLALAGELLLVGRWVLSREAARSRARG